MTCFCPTSQCTWDPYGSLAIYICTIEDVSSTIIDRGNHGTNIGSSIFSVPALDDVPRQASGTLATGITFCRESLYFGGLTNQSHVTSVTPLDIAEMLFLSRLAQYRQQEQQEGWTAFRDIGFMPPEVQLDIR